MKTLCTLFLFLLVSLLSSAQDDSTKTLSIKQLILSNQYYINSESVSYKDFKKELHASDPKLATMFNSGKNLSIAGSVIGFVGAFCVGWDLVARVTDRDEHKNGPFPGGGISGGGYYAPSGHYILEKKRNPAMLIAGGSVMAGGIIMHYIGKGKMKKAISLHEKNNTALNIGTSDLGLAIGISF